MRLRLLLVGLIIVATAAFVVGVSVERSSADSHDEPAASESGEAGETGEHSPEESEREEGTHAEEPATETEAHDEEEATILGLDLEATPFVGLAATFSLALAAAVWLRPAWGWLLPLIGVVMAVFAALDVREVFHQLDESNGGLAVLAAAVAALHLAAAALATRMSTRAASAG